MVSSEVALMCNISSRIHSSCRIQTLNSDRGSFGANPSSKVVVWQSGCVFSGVKFDLEDVGSEITTNKEDERKRENIRKGVE